MADVDPAVSKFFERHLSTWKNALARWHKKCGGKEKQKQKLKRDFPVADRRGPVSGFPDRNAAVSDATSFGYPSKTLADQQVESDIGQQAAKCKEVIEHIQKMMELLNNARTTGRFPSLRQYTVALRKQPKYITSIDREHKVARGEVVEVLEKKNDWLRIRTADAEGWIQQTELMPKLPMEMTSEAGGPAGTEIGAGGKGEVETGVRDTVGGY